mmetsp:Transcript_25098/g.79532  ORF Transcript_25098/g.79532 Transcript_25098/m.79532 type:complete len:460 (-) Transcript_25098:425-1804(-)
MCTTSATRAHTLMAEPCARSGFSPRMALHPPPPDLLVVTGRHNQVTGGRSTNNVGRVRFEVHCKLRTATRSRQMELTIMCTSGVAHILNMFVGSHYFNVNVIRSILYFYLLPGRVLTVTSYFNQDKCVGISIVDNKCMLYSTAAIRRILTSGMPGVKNIGSNYYSALCRESVLQQSSSHQSDIRRRQLKQRPPGWKKGYPNKLIYNMILNSVRNSAHYCPYKVKECVKPGVVYKQNVRHKKGKVISFEHRSIQFHESSWKDFPSVPRHSWGSCAFVSLGSNILKHKRGKEIDSHDTIIRLGHAPVKGYEAYVGSLTSVVVGRGASTRMMPKFAYSNKSAIYLGRDIKEVGLTEAPIVPGSVGDNMAPNELSRLLYKHMTSPIGGKPRGESTGFLKVLDLIFSKFCSRFDIYGMSPSGGGFYYLKGGQDMKIHHSVELENWVLHYLMETFSDDIRVCVYI